MCSLGAPSLLRSLLESQARAETPVVPQNTAEEEEDDGAGAVKGVLGTRGLTPLSGRARAALLRSHGVQQQQQQDAEQVITPSSLPLYLCNPGPAAAGQQGGVRVQLRPGRLQLQRHLPVRRGRGLVPGGATRLPLLLSPQLRQPCRQVGLENKML